MSDKGIIFSAPMVRALLDGRKTQTRRLLKPQPPEWATYCEQPQMLNALHQWVPSGLWRWSEPEQTPLRALREWPVDKEGSHYWLRPAYQRGDRLYVRESWRVGYGHDWYREDLGRPPKPSEYDPATTPVEYLADNVQNLGGRSWPSIFLPRWASRLWLAVTDVRVQRLQAISLGDICAEGLASSIYDFKPVQRGFDDWEALWNSLHTADGERWEDNPWIVAVTFDVHHGNIDEVAA